jgi:hypothetical protein
MRRGNFDQIEQILLERRRAQATKALIAFIDGDQSVLTPSGCPYKGQSDRRPAGLKEKLAKRLFASVNGLTSFLPRSKRKDNGDSDILRGQVDLLGEALTNVIVELEIIKDDMPLSGPQALLFAEDAVQAIKQLKARECVPFQETLH